MTATKPREAGADTFTCCLCEKTYAKERDDDEALAEMQADFGAVPVEECDVVCDDCYQQVRPS